MSREPILISAEALHERLPDPEWAIIDCRFDLANPDAGRDAYERAHLPGALFLDLDRDLAGPVKPDTGRHPLPEIPDFCRKLGEKGIANTNTIVVYDGGHGAVAARAWWIFRWLGHRSVFLLDGGLGVWESLGLPVDAEAPGRPNCEYVADPDSSKVLTTAELAGDYERIGAMNLLDARDTARFIGEHEPIDPIAGHIPGALSVPFTGFVNADGTWRSQAEREALLEDMLGTDRETTWCVMCGSGVTACHLVISGLEAGFREPRVYVGSWSEWIRDPDRPIWTGPD